MGTIVYGTSEQRFVLDDRTLAHLKTITLMKLRRNESFSITLRDSSSDHGRVTLWLHPSIPLQFAFDTDETFDMDRPLLEELMHGANGGELTVR
ncbi:hypothetical protein KXS11_17075 [Plantibacter flavus]|uniref:DUF7882 family protein n=1 Tax=Plantibacter flavus TaxID=150123 RepID=UPI003F185CDA